MTIEQNQKTNDIKSGSAGAVMKVTNNSLNNGIQGTRPESAGKRDTLATQKKAAHGGRTDRVELSISQERIDRLTSTIASMESANSEKIDSLKRQIADGTYAVSGHAVAEKMLRSLGIVDNGDEA